MSRRKFITGHAFFQALVAAGLFSQDEGGEVRRVVIDAGPDGTVVMYVERWGDERLLHVALTLDGVEIRGVPKEPNGG